MKSLILVTAFLLSSAGAMAHEGHDDAPGVLKANHGGVVKPGHQMNLEYVISGTEVKLFPVSHEGGDLPLANVKLSGTAKSPKGKEEPFKLESKDGAFVGNVDFKGAYRVEVRLVADVSGKKDNFKFQVEKQ
jgi:hypothetical protein